MANTFPSREQMGWFNGDWGTSEVVEFFREQRLVQFVEGIHDIWLRAVTDDVLRNLDDPRGRPYVRPRIEQIGMGNLPLVLRLDERYTDDNGVSGNECALVRANPQTGEVFGDADHIPVCISDTGELMTPGGDHWAAQYTPEQQGVLLEQWRRQRELGVLVLGVMHYRPDEL